MLEQKSFRTRCLERAAAFVACLLLLSFSSRANADPTNYQRYVIGERALGMGGAQTGAVNDPMANLYNPAAMVFTSSTMVSASKALYSLDIRRIKGGFIPFQNASATESVDAVTLEQKHDLTLPSTLAISTKFGHRLGKKGPQRHAFGFAILVPNQDSYKMSASWKGEGALEGKETYSISETDLQAWTGLSYAFLATRKLGLGASAFIVRSRWSRSWNMSRHSDYGPCGDASGGSCGLLEFSNSDISVDVVSFMFRAGVTLKPSKNWRFGAVVTSPTILVKNMVLWKTEGKLSQTRGYAETTETEGESPGLNYYFHDEYELEVAIKEPMAIRIGSAFAARGFTLDTDVALHFPISYKRINGDPVFDRMLTTPTASPNWFDEGVVKEIERRAVVNFNIGWEKFLTKHWTIRNGYFTDFSSAPVIVPSEFPQLNRIHRFGATISGGFKAKGYDISVGAMGALGNGHASVYHPELAGTPYPWQPAQLQERALYIFIAGVQAAAVKSTKKLAVVTYEKIKENDEEADEGTVEGEEAPQGNGEPVSPTGDEAEIEKLSQNSSLAIDLS